MKIRSGFVSNSSTSSFIILNVSDRKVKDKLTRALRLDELLDEEDYWYENILEAGWENYDYGLYNHKKSGIIAALTEDGDVWSIGLELEKLLKQDLNLSQCKQLLKEKLKELKIDIEDKDMSIRVDQSSSG